MKNEWLGTHSVVSYAPHVRMVASPTDQDGLLLKRQLNLPFLGVRITTPTWCVEPCHALDSKYNKRFRDFAALPNLYDTFVTTSICPNSPQ